MREDMEGSHCDAL